MSVAALSFGVGAFYVAGTAAATGSLTALLGSISADAAASAPTVRRLYKYARQGQRVVQIGQVIGIGGGSWLTSKLVGAPPTAAELELAKREKDASSWNPLKRRKGKKSSAKGMSEEELRQLAERQRKRAEEQAESSTARALKNLLEGSVLSSHAWWLRTDRTLRIVGGPRASEVEGFLVIETDTYEPFLVVDEAGATVGEGVEKLPAPGEEKRIEAAATAAAAGSASEGEAGADAEEKNKSDGAQPLVAGTSSTAATGSTWKERLSLTLADATTSANETLGEWRTYVMAQAAATQEAWAERQRTKREAAVKEGAKWKGDEKKDGETEKQGEAAKEEKGGEEEENSSDESDSDADSIPEEVIRVTSRSSEQNTAPGSTATPSLGAQAAATASQEQSKTTAADHDDKPPSANSETSPFDKLIEMGFERAEARSALLRAQGDLNKALEQLMNKDRADAQGQSTEQDAPAQDEDTPMAVQEQDGAESAAVGGVATPPAEPAAVAAPAPAVPGRVLPVKGGEDLTKPHVLTRAGETATAVRERVEGVPLLGTALRYGSGWALGTSTTPVAEQKKNAEKGKKK